MRAIGDAEIQIGQGLFDAAEFVLNRFDPFADCFHSCHGGVSWLLVAFQLGDFFRSFLEFRSKLLDLAGQGAALFDQPPEAVPGDVSSAGSELFSEAA